MFGNDGCTFIVKAIWHKPNVSIYCEPLVENI